MKQNLDEAKVLLLRVLVSEGKCGVQLLKDIRKFFEEEEK